MDHLPVMEQGEHLSRRNDILVARGERATVCNNQYASVTITPAKTTKDIADEAGLSKSSVHKRLQIAADIAEDVRDKLRDTDIAERSDRWLAGDVGISKNTVHGIREQLESTGQIDQLTAFTGKDGKTRPRGNGLNQLRNLRS